MNLFQLAALVGLTGGAIAGVSYGEHHAPLSLALSGILGGIIGFIGGFVATPVIIVFGHTIAKIEHKLQSFRTAGIDHESKDSDKGVEIKNTKQ